MGDFTHIAMARQSPTGWAPTTKPIAHRGGLLQRKNPHPCVRCGFFESFRLKGLGLGLAVLCQEHVLVDQQLGAAVGGGVVNRVTVTVVGHCCARIGPVGDVQVHRVVGVALKTKLALL